MKRKVLFLVLALLPVGLSCTSHEAPKVSNIPGDNIELGPSVYSLRPSGYRIPDLGSLPGSVA